MAELSSNWKKLQAKLKTEPNSNKPVKRKADQMLQLPMKKSKITKITSRETATDGNKNQATTGKNSKLLFIKGMGGTQSRVEGAPKPGHSASLAIWAADNDISSEALAEAYDLGLPNNSMMVPFEKDKVNHGLSEKVDIGKYVAIDCEMVGVGVGGYESALARVSLVDFHGRQIYDSYVKPRERVTDWRTFVSGVSPKHMRFARDFDEVQQQVYNVLRDRILVGHDIKHDLDALQLSHAPRNIRDTAKYPGFRKYGNGRKPALRILAKELLQMEIQEGSHSSIEDARATMLLFRKHKSGFDVEHSNRYAPKLDSIRTSQNRKKPKKNHKTR